LCFTRLAAFPEPWLIFESLENSSYRRAAPGTRPIHELFAFFSEALGADFLSKALHWGYDSGLRASRDQWKQLTIANPNIATPEDKSSMERNRVWETAIGSIAKTFCSEVDFVEPDVICTFEKKKIAIAAKMAYSEKNIFENVKKGLRQAKGAESNDSVDAYLIFVNVVQIYPLLDVFTKIARLQFPREALTESLKGEVMAWCDRLPLEREARRIAKERRNRLASGSSFHLH
jgi:hypothetical protein